MGHPLYHIVPCKEFREFQALQTQAEQLHSADQAAIVIEGAAVTSKPTEVYGKLRAVSLRRKSYQCIQINGSVSDCPTSKGF